MTIVAWLQSFRVIIFGGLAFLALGLWWRQRSKPAALLAGVFVLLALALLFARISPTAAGVLGKPGRDATVIAFLWIPWLLAVFAWSFGGTLPRWLRLITIPLVALSLWKIALPPLPAPGEPRYGVFAWFTGLFIGTWTLLMLAACYRLWRAGGHQLVVRARMRTMAAGALMLNIALLASGWVRPAEASGAYLAILMLSLVSAGLFLTGFAPPQQLRTWWRRRAYDDWQHMQTELIAAVTPSQVARAVVPMLSEVVGGGAAVFTHAGQVLAHEAFTETDIEHLQACIEAGDLPSPSDQVFATDNCWLVLRPSAHSPLFGDHEVALVEGFRLHLRLALERAELYEANLRSKAELERANQEVESMLIGLGHDLRTPAMTIAGFTDLLRQDPDAPDRDHLFESLSESARYLSRLIEALLELSSVGRRGLEVQNVDLDAVVRTTITRLSPSFPGLQVVVPEPLPSVAGVPLRMEQLFDNLLTNAARHGGRDPITVTITWEAVQDRVRLIVGDDGTGIAPADREVVFTPFRRGNDATTAGSGVGLGLVRRIVEAVGGTIRLAPESRGDQGGAMFEIELPAAVSRTAPPSAPHRSIHERRTPDPPTSPDQADSGPGGNSLSH